MGFGRSFPHQAICKLVIFEALPPRGRASRRKTALAFQEISVRIYSRFHTRRLQSKRYEGRDTRHGDCGFHAHSKDRRHHNGSNLKGQVRLLATLKSLQPKSRDGPSLPSLSRRVSARASRGDSAATRFRQKTNLITAGAFRIRGTQASTSAVPVHYSNSAPHQACAFSVSPNEAAGVVSSKK